MKTNISILWDIENVTPSSDSLFVEGLLDYAQQIGNISSALVIGNWTTKIANTLAVSLSEKGFELVHLPQPDDKGKRKKNSSDFVLITKATEMIFQYPHIRTYILLTGDIDFRPLIQLLKKHGKRVIVICDSNNASENLLEFADEYMDYRNLLPDDQDEPTPDNTEIARNLTREEAFPLLAEAVKAMLAKKQIPTPGSVKVRMQLLNENFSGTIEGYPQWQDFIQAAVKQNVITIANNGRGFTLSLPANKLKHPSASNTPKIIRLLLGTMADLSPKNKWIDFSQVNNALIEKGINIKAYHYSKFKKLILDAEKRNLVETKNNNLKWYVRKR